MTATEPVDLLIRAADAGDTYLTWRWLDDPTRPDYHVLDADQLAGPLDRLASSLVALLPGESQAQAVERALSRGAFADPDREARAVIGVGRTPAHCTRWLPFAAQRFDDVGGGGMKAGIGAGARKGHGKNSS